MKFSQTLVTAALLILIASGCSNDPGQKESAKSAEWQRGRATYIANCVACHNNDPSRDGPIGPAIQGSSKELLAARVLTTSYPQGYQPKRPTQVMPQFPFLKEEIPYLAAYLR